MCAHFTLVCAPFSGTSTSLGIGIGAQLSAICGQLGLIRTQLGGICALRNHTLVSRRTDIRLSYVRFGLTALPFQISAAEFRLDAIPVGIVGDLLDSADI